jgi:pimeloyl-ACP methyl ester carboxylesterase
VLLHGWPEFWLTWQPVMTRLADRFELIAPDLRGFGDSDKPSVGPSDEAGPDVHAADVLALIDTFGLDRVGIVAHDVGAYVAQSFTRQQPERVVGLFLLDCPYPGIGRRWAEAGHLIETWYQYFHQMPWAAELVGASREACGSYVSHFLRHWAHRKDAFDDVLEAWIDNFMKPGNLQGGFNWYISSARARRAMIEGAAPETPKITVPACVRWGEHDPILPVRWADRLGEYFGDLDFAPFGGVGHFPHREAPDRTAAEIAAFFARLTDGEPVNSAAAGR